MTDTTAGTLDAFNRVGHHAGMHGAQRPIDFDVAIIAIRCKSDHLIRNPNN